MANLYLLEDTRERSKTRGCLRVCIGQRFGDREKIWVLWRGLKLKATHAFHTRVALAKAQRQIGHFFQEVHPDSDQASDWVNSPRSSP